MTTHGPGGPTQPTYGRMARPDDIPTASRPVSDAAWAFLVEQWGDGLFDVLHVEMTPGADTYAVAFHDDGELLRLRDLAYSEDVGLFARTDFPDEPDVAEARAAIIAVLEGRTLAAVPLQPRYPTTPPSDDTPAPEPPGGRDYYLWLIEHPPCVNCGVTAGVRDYDIARPTPHTPTEDAISADLCAPCAASSIAVAQVYLADYEERQRGHTQTRRQPPQ